VCLCVCALRVFTCDSGADWAVGGLVCLAAASRYRPGAEACRGGGRRGRGRASVVVRLLLLLGMVLMMLMMLSLPAVAAFCQPACSCGRVLASCPVFQDVRDCSRRLRRRHRRRLNRRCAFRISSRRCVVCVIAPLSVCGPLPFPLCTSRHREGPSWGCRQFK
jgi:hypothetical protein